MRLQAKANVCNVRRHRIFSCGDNFFVFFPKGQPLEAVSIVVQFCLNMLSKSFCLMLVVSSNRVTGNGLGIAEGGDF